ncbi:hypothetical protein J1N35_011176 [Gossypium stocksii]|uniref:Uncharacterized protein n=1 Tax=Gossypium stocksii TaxID=47602 RepID=A0A9D3W304_9ROSI|nr:hypothetical protein J1N35_011176 [Gossypium stocksii]
MNICSCFYCIKPLNLVEPPLLQLKKLIYSSEKAAVIKRQNEEPLQKVKVPYNEKERQRRRLREMPGFMRDIENKLFLVDTSLSNLDNFVDLTSFCFFCSTVCE